MGAVWVRARGELRRRWKAVAALAVLMGLVGGVALFGVAGARRTASAMDRFVGYSRPTEAFVLGAELDLDAVAALPQVVESDGNGYFLMAPSTPSGEPDPSLGINPISSTSGRLLTALDRPLVVSGRLPDHGEVLEVAVNEELAEARGVASGDTLVMWAYAADQFFNLFEDPAALGTLLPDGPRLELRVTGVIRHPRDVAPYADDDEVAYLSKQNLFLTAAFHQRYHDEIANFGQLVGEILGVRLAGGRDDLPGFAEAVRALPGGASAEIDTEASAGQALDAGRRAIDLQAMGLLVFAALVAAAGVAVVGQSLARQTHAAAADHRALSALGMTPAQLRAVVALPVLAAGVGASVVAVAVAVMLSPLAPVGVARTAEVDPGLAVDGPVLVLGALAVAVAVLARAAGPAWRASRLWSRTAGSWSSAASDRPARLAERLAAAGAPASAVVGVRMAVQPEGGTGTVPVRTALAGAVVAVGAGAAALVFTASLDRLVSTPALQGWGWDVVVGDGNVDNLDRGKQLLPANAVAGGFSAVTPPATLAIAGTEVGVVGLLSLQGDTGPEVLEGRLPSGGDEVALGTKTMEQLAVRIGDRVDVVTDSSAEPSSFDVVGVALLGSPGINFEVDGLGHGAVVTFEAMEAMFGEVQAGAFLVDYAAGVDPQLGFAALQADWGQTVLRAVAPDQVENLRPVARLPLVFAGLLAVLAAATLGHTLVTATGRRRRELAALRTLGFVRRQVAATLAWQATTLAVLALVAGLPLGVAFGRWGWTVVAASIGTPAAPATPLVAVLAIVPLTVLAANALAALPARRAARIRPAVALRAER